MKLFRLLLERRTSAGVALLLLYLIVLVTGWTFWPKAFFHGYWFALMFWMQLTIGAWIVLLLQELTGGEWGHVAAPYLRTASSGIFILAPLFLLPLLALPHIFSWTTITPGVSAATLVNKQPWLNSTAFTIRTVFYLALLVAMIRLRRHPKLSAFAGPMLLLTVILFSFYSADWMMSLQPTFYSSLYPFMYFSGSLVAIFSLICATASWLQLKGFAPRDPDVLLAYGKLLFASVLFWGYIVFAQFIIIWTGNLPDEAEWYVVRSEPAWLWFTLLVLACHFAIPFCLLLSQSLKKDARQLFAVAAPLFGMHFLEIFWLMRPTPGEGFLLTPFDFLMPLFFGVVWLWFVLNAGESVAESPLPQVAHET